MRVRWFVLYLMCLWNFLFEEREREGEVCLTSSGIFLDRILLWKKYVLG